MKININKNDSCKVYYTLEIFWRVVVIRRNKVLFLILNDL